MYHDGLTRGSVSVLQQRVLAEIRHNNHPALQIDDCLTPRTIMKD